MTPKEFIERVRHVRTIDVNRHPGDYEYSATLPSSPALVLMGYDPTGFFIYVRHEGMSTLQVEFYINDGLIWYQDITDMGPDKREELVKKLLLDGHKLLAMLGSFDHRMESPNEDLDTELAVFVFGETHG